MSTCSPFTANGSTGRTLGSKSITFNLVNFKSPFTWKFHIADVTLPILGIDFLSANQLFIDCTRLSLTHRDGLKTQTYITDANHTDHMVPNICNLVSRPRAKHDPYVEVLFNRFPNLLHRSTEPNANSAKYSHAIVTTATCPLRERVRQLSNEKLEYTRVEFKTLETNGVIRRSSSHWASPLHVVPKKDGSFRPCGDYRRLNKITVHDSYPMPLINMSSTIFHMPGSFPRWILLKLITRFQYKNPTSQRLL